MRGKLVAHRFALISQLAGVQLDPTRNALALQSGSDVGGAWDPRSFASRVIVPWLRNHRSPLGNSGDPYVSNPLRRTTISPSPEGVKRSSLPFWKDLYDLLTEAQIDPAKANALFRQTVAVTRRLVDEQDRPLELPEKVSPQIVLEAVDRFLMEPSGGDRAMAVVTSIFSVLISPLISISSVKRAAVNASDESSGVTGDITCLDASGEILLVVEVKERSLSFEDVRSSLGKIKDAPFGRYVFSSPQIERVDSDRITSLSKSTFEKNGRSCHFVSIFGLLSACLLMHDHSINRKFLLEIENSLSEFNTQPANRTAWRDLLSDIT